MAVRFLTIGASLWVLSGCGGTGDPIGDDTGTEDTGQATEDPLQPLTQADAILWGDAPGDFAGSAVAFVGDVTGDGQGDLLVGVPADEEGATGAGGAVFVPGPLAGEHSLGEVGFLLTGSGTETAGLALAALGDPGQDGVNDFAVGAPYSDGSGLQRGAVYLFQAPVSAGGALDDADAIVRGGFNYALAGWSLGGGEDLDGDGVPDLLVGAKWQGSPGKIYAGAVYVFYDVGSGETSVLDADRILQGTAANDVAGQSAALIQDIDGDGLADVLIGAVWHSPDGDREHAGAAYLVTSSQLEALGSDPASLEEAHASLMGENADDLAGWDVSSGGDINGDGVGDLLISAPAHSESEELDQAGATYVVLGPVEGTVELAEADVRILGDELLEWSGMAVTSAGDQDGDGATDVLVGSIYRSTGDSYIAGGALLFTDLEGGDVTLSEATRTYAGALENDVSGWDLDGGADMNDDGQPDIVIGSSGADQGENADVGAVHLFWGPLVSP